MVTLGHMLLLVVLVQIRLVSEDYLTINCGSWGPIQVTLRLLVRGCYLVGTIRYVQMCLCAYLFWQDPPFLLVQLLPKAVSFARLRLASCR